jgi:hypothetical protein
MKWERADKMQQCKRHFKKIGLIVRVVAVLFLMMALSCSSVRMTMSPRSTLEEKLLVQGLKKALSSIDIESLKGKRVTLNIVGLTKDDMPFAEEYVRIWLITNGVSVVQDQNESDLSLRVLLDVLAVDNSETIFGTPQFTFLGVPIPAIAIYQNVRNRGRTELKMVALDNKAEILVEEFPLGVGVAKYDRYTVLFIISWTSTDLDIKPDQIEK